MFNGLFKKRTKGGYASQKGNSSLDLSLDKNFDQKDSIPFLLISLIGFITENNTSSINVSQSTLTIAGLIVYNYEKGTLMWKHNRQGVNKSTKKVRNSSYDLYFLEAVFVHSR